MCIEGEELAIVLTNRILELVRHSGASQLETLGALNAVKELIPTLNMSLVPTNSSSPESG